MTTRGTVQYLAKHVREAGGSLAAFYGHGWGVRADALRQARGEFARVDNASFSAADFKVAAAVRPDLTFGGLTLDPKTSTAVVRGQTVELGATQFALLKLLVSNAGTVLPHDRILQDVWGSQGGTKRALECQVDKLRKKIGASPEIHTVFGVGLVLREPGAFLDPNQHGKITVDDLVLNALTRSAKRGDRRLTLTRYQFEILETLMRNPDRVATRSQLGALMTRRKELKDPRAVTVAISLLRKELGEPRLVLTEPGVGYVLRREP